MNEKRKIKVAIFESERGWGQRIDEVKEFNTREEAVKFIEKYNGPNLKQWKKDGFVPSWYMQAVLLNDK